MGLMRKFSAWLQERAILGGAHGEQRGPMAGTGASVHSSTGVADFDGTPGDELPPRKDPVEDQPYPVDRAGD